MPRINFSLSASIDPTNYELKRLTCITCGKKLSGKQKRFCCPLCNSLYHNKREKHIEGKCATPKNAKNIKLTKALQYINRMFFDKSKITENQLKEVAHYYSVKINTLRNQIYKQTKV